MEIFYLNKEKKSHTRFQNRYSVFRMIKLKRGEIFTQKENNELTLCFIRNGSIMIKKFSQSIPNQMFTGNNIILFSKATHIHIEALEDTDIITLSCNYPHPSAYALSWNYLKEEYSKIKTPVKKNIYSLPISKNMSLFLKTLEVYFIKKGNSPESSLFLQYIHQIKEEELFNVFQMDYSPEELIGFFPDRIPQDLHFYAMVISNYKECRTVKELIKKTGCCSNTFHKLFKEKFKKTPYKWLNEQRCKSIMEDLTTKDISMKDIVFKYNFCSASHFTSYCIKHFGMPPSLIRKNTLYNKKQ